MNVVGCQRGMQVIRAGRADNYEIMPVRMGALMAAPVCPRRIHHQRGRMPDPGHQDGESQGKNHLGADGFAEHGLRFGIDADGGLTAEMPRLPHPPRGDRMRA